MGINKHIASVSFLLATLTISAQQNTAANTAQVIENSPSESLFLHLNASSFVSGETLFYKIYSLNPVNNKASDVSKIAYVELIDIQKNSIVKQKLFLKNGLAQSDFFIPASLKTGNYKLVAYTNWMLNKGTSELFQQEIFILNPFEDLPESTIAKENENFTPSEKKSVSSAAKTTSDLRIDLNKKVFKQRDEAVLNIAVSSLLSGNYSVSVRKMDSLPSPSMQSSTDFKPNAAKSQIAINSNKIILPEMRGELITGKIEAGDKNLQINNVAVALSIPGKSFVFKIVRTNRQGEFFFTIDQTYQNPEYIIQVIGEKNALYNVSINTKETINYDSLEFTNTLKISPSLKNNLRERSISSQVENAYFSKKTDSLTAIATKLFFDPYSKSYHLDDYTRFSTLKQTVTEVVTEMSYTKSRGKYMFHLKDFKAQEQVQEPILTLVDGILVQDVTDIAEYEAKNIEKINIIPKGYIYGGTITSGYVSIFTKTGDFDTDIITSRYFNFNAGVAPQPEKIYFKQYYNAETKDNRIPDFRNQLLWLPEVALSEKNNKISFFTSDIPGNYEISIEGFTENGKPISTKEYFEVK